MSRNFSRRTLKWSSESKCLRNHTWRPFTGPYMETVYGVEPLQRWKGRRSHMWIGHVHSRDDPSVTCVFEMTLRTVVDSGTSRKCQVRLLSLVGKGKREPTSGSVRDFRNGCPYRFFDNRRELGTGLVVGDSGHLKGVRNNFVSFVT